MDIKNALFIVLGKERCWENDSIRNGKIRIGWKKYPLNLLQNNDWDKIWELHQTDRDYEGNKKQATQDFNILKKFIEADENTVFITFSSSLEKIFWCTSKKGSINEDNISKYLETEINWSDKSIDGIKVFNISSLSNELTKYRSYSATGFTFENKTKYFNYIKKIINNEISEKETREINEKETEARILSKIRKGQQKFKNKLLRKYGKCLLCNIDMQELLIGSHIKPWSKSDNRERLDVNNGLLLCPIHDKLFDLGLISFNTDGKIIISKRIKKKLVNELKLRELKINIEENMEEYIIWHKKNKLM